MTAKEENILDLMDYFLRADQDGTRADDSPKQILYYIDEYMMDLPRDTILRMENEYGWIMVSSNGPEYLPCREFERKGGIPFESCTVFTLRDGTEVAIGDDPEIDGIVHVDELPF